MMMDPYMDEYTRELWDLARMEILQRRREAVAARAATSGGDGGGTTSDCGGGNVDDPVTAGDA
jgi:hypothetical protein